MDAAGPLFEKTTKDVRIDKSDASFVDLIHSNGGNEDKEGLQILMDLVFNCSILTLSEFYIFKDITFIIKILICCS